MNVELTVEDYEALMTSLNYSRQRVEDTRGTPHDVKQQNLARIQAVREKLIAARNGENLEG